ncbi:MAG: prepilin-type N-terminal cleavage/methylation domain-containing protein [Candidatus Omnitrophica bacterium]|nr:prepilin-type N-terminal cleavage/methylation domain-containing protein [Candidatus Omnitrophota bacterium]MBU1924942.1 prepilin-type N-terminal cleavage/methylation domain-containing protein [Candidatus Omnitrophota bacterium]MBU2063569.1 prepilin-type N-terminal cleavage/methylation domain-containing protein [Candidatus Omnitrophota bacterium]
MKNSAFTLMELVLVVVIIAVLLSIAVPSYIDTVEKARAREAKATLSAMIAAEQMYAAERREYLQVNSTNPGTQIEDELWEAIGLDNPNKNPNRAFDYHLTAGTGVCTATATRIDGPYLSDYITMDQDGSTDDTTFWMD